MSWETIRGPPFKLKRQKMSAVIPRSQRLSISRTV